MNKRVTKQRNTLAAAVTLAWLVGGCVSYEPRLPETEEYFPGAATPRRLPIEAESQTAANEPVTMSLEAAERIALADNPGLQALREGVAATHQAVGVAWSAYYPRIGVDGGYRRWESHAFLPDGVGASLGRAPGTVGPVDDWSAGLAASLTLFDGGRRRAAVQAAKARAGAGDADLLSAERALLLEVRRAFYGALAAEDGLRVALAARDQAAEHLRLVNERVEAGVVLAADRMRAQVALSERELALVGARHLVRVANGNLNTVMGLPVETTLVKLEHADIFTEIPLEEALETCFDLALKQRPELLAARNRVAARRAGVEQAKSAFMPQVTGVARYGRRDDDFAPSDTDSAIGVAIELPLFTGFARGHQLDRSRHELRSSEAELQAAILRIRSEVWEARSRLTEAQAADAAATALTAEAAESLRLEKARYQSGASGISDLLDAQTSLTRAEGAASSARWALYISLAEWQHALGTPSARRP